MLLEKKKTHKLYIRVGLSIHIPFFWLHRTPLRRVVLNFFLYFNTKTHNPFTWSRKEKKKEKNYINNIGGSYIYTWTVTYWRCSDSTQSSNASVLHWKVDYSSWSSTFQFLLGYLLFRVVQLPYLSGQIHPNAHASRSTSDCPSPK